IVADVGIDDLEVVAQLRRGESVELAPGKQPWEEDFTEPKPRASYHGVIVMRLQAGVWPPKPDRPVVFAYPNTKSTSGFIYPRSLFKERGFIDSGAVKFFPPLQEGELSRLWEIASSGQVGSKDSKGLLDELEQGTEAFDLVGTNNSHYQGYLSEEERKRFVVVHTSDPIPFDAFVIRRTPESVLNPDNERQVELLREALLSTQSLSRAARQKVFPWFQENGSGAENSRLDRFRRYPDIFDWIDSSNEAYDSVRRVAVRTTGGTIVRLGISEYVHRQIKEDTSRYFNDIKRRLLKGSTTEAMRAQDRVFLDVIIYPKDRLSEMEKDLRSGALDLAELPAALAMQMVGEGHSVFATSLFVSPDAPSEIASYHYQIWTRRTDTARDQISDQFRFAHTTRESLSGFRMPFHDLKNEGLVDLENLREDQLVACGSAAGVFKALIDDEADYGFIADFERKYLDYIFSENDRAKVESLPPHK
ncbi:MAG TPA: PhnD/SsuA/transferrin family substrate-binding protein, partial [Planctomycetaceae bacterium]|nr:PhnD/SsuA/transferrin family substrate-binding protein [Planctomycetaceae bacterium]